MPDSFSLDYETYSEAPLGGKKGVGAYKYAEHPSTEILLAAVSKNGAEPLLWDRYYQDLEAEELVMEMASGSENIISAWNANFEAAISKYLFLSTFGVNAPLLHQWRCPASVARRMAIPFGLGDAAAFLGLGEQKDKRGSALIKIFSIPQTTGKRKGERIHPIKDAEMIVTVAGVKMPVHEAWQLFRAYCIQDVKTEQAAAQRLKSAEFKGDILDGFQFDMIMNDRGIPVDVEALHMAKKIVDDYSGTLISEFQTITGGMVPTQVAALLPWLQERGYKGDNLRAATMEEAMDDDEEEDTDENSNAMWRDDATPEARRALAIRQAISFAAVKKIPKMIDAACSDGRVRGALMFWGAQRTGRSSGRIIQPQNFRRPTIESHVQAFWDIRNGMDWSEIEMLHGPVLEVLASTMRHFIREPERQLLDADFSQIEARVTAWIAGHKTLLDAFRRGEDLYKITYVGAFGGRVEDVTKDQRFIGKVMALFLGYNGGENAYIAGAKTYGVEVDSKKAQAIVDAYRENNPEMPSLWRAMQKAAVAAINEPGTIHKIPTCDIAFQVRNFGGYQNLFMRLPSGRQLVYPRPQVVKVVKKFYDKKKKEWRDWEVNQVSYWGQRKNVWCRVETHGGVLTENASQAIAGEFLTLGVVRAEKAGYGTFMVVHDQALAAYNPELGQSSEGFSKLLCELPPWAPDFPLEAKTDIVDFYTKD